LRVLHQLKIEKSLLFGAFSLKHKSRPILQILMGNGNHGAVEGDTLNRLDQASELTGLFTPRHLEFMFMSFGETSLFHRLTYAHYKAPSHQNNPKHLIIISECLPTLFLIKMSMMKA